jgi:hypothetical protein
MCSSAAKQMGGKWQRMGTALASSERHPLSVPVEWKCCGPRRVLPQGRDSEIETKTDAARQTRISLSRSIPRVDKDGDLLWSTSPSYCMCKPSGNESRKSLSSTTLPTLDMLRKYWRGVGLFVWYDCRVLLNSLIVCAPLPDKNDRFIHFVGSQRPMASLLNRAKKSQIDDEEGSMQACSDTHQPAARSPATPCSMPAAPLHADQRYNPHVPDTRCESKRKRDQ